jgi:hypothetical protein
MGRAEQLIGMRPQLTADVTMYPTDQGGRKSLALPGWGCPCCYRRNLRLWDVMAGRCSAMRRLRLVKAGV